MNNKFYFSIPVTDEQIIYAKELVDYSLKHHPISNIWDKEKKNKTEELRFTGSVGEVVFADLYKLKRPSRSFGAIDGQDFGKDFEITIKTIKMNFDIKTMHRKSNIFYKNYVLNVPARNIKRKDSITDYYYCISIHEHNKKTFASVLGYVLKNDIVSGKIGKLYKKGTARIRGDKTSFTFFEDTYEILFADLTTPFTSKRIKAFKGYKTFVLR